MTSLAPFARIDRKVPIKDPQNLLPVCEEMGDILRELGTFDITKAATSPEARYSKEETRLVIQLAILPLAQELDFMGLKAPTVVVRAGWMPVGSDVEVPSCRDVPYTTGRVCVSAGLTTWNLVRRMNNASTTAHRRYKDAFAGERVLITLYPSENRVEIHGPKGLRDALNDGLKCWALGK